MLPLLITLLEIVALVQQLTPFQTYWVCYVTYKCTYIEQTVESTKVPPDLSSEVAGFFSAPTEPVCQEVCTVEFCSCNEFCACLFSFPVGVHYCYSLFFNVLGEC